MKSLVIVTAVTGAFLGMPHAVSAQKSKQPITSSSLQAPNLGGARVLVKYYQQYYPTTTTRFGHLLLFPNGVAFDDIPTKPLANFKAATIRRLLDARDVGRWKMAGNALQLTFPRGKRTLRQHRFGWYDGEGAIPAEGAYDIYYPVIAPPRGKMLGAWKNNSLIVLGTQGGGAPMVAAGSSGDWKFNADGTFSDGSQSFTSGTTLNMGEAYKGEGDIVSTSKTKRQSSGKWRIDGPLLTLEKEGKRTVHFAFLMPHWTKNMAQTDLMIDGDRWKRPDRK
jgi:hypothetical protein